jgi:hypothetical protein
VGTGGRIQGRRWRRARRMNQMVLWRWGIGEPPQGVVRMEEEK